MSEFELTPEERKEIKVRTRIIGPEELLRRTKEEIKKIIQGKLGVEELLTKVEVDAQGKWCSSILPSLSSSQFYAGVMSGLKLKNGHPTLAGREGLPMDIDPQDELSEIIFRDEENQGWHEYITRLRKRFEDACSGKDIREDIINV